MFSESGVDKMRKLSKDGWKKCCLRRPKLLCFESTDTHLIYRFKRVDVCSARRTVRSRLSV